ncbi:MAG: GGDEF domain-containing protein [Burkholderiaceae bacterium]
MSIERSTELLREALPWMSRQAAGLHPVSYAVWFEYVARANAPLRAAIDEHLAREGRLDEFATHALFKRHVADVDPESAQRVVDGMQRVLGGIGEAAASAGAHAARFGASLAQLAGALERGDAVRGIGHDAAVAHNGPAPRMLADVVAEVIADTGTMRSQIGGLQQRLADSRREIERLRDEVRRARDEALRDALTGLANRRAFDQALAACLLALGDGAPTAHAGSAARAAVDAIDAAMAPSASRPPVPGASSAPRQGGFATGLARGPWLLLSDVDRFERIGESYGREFGDQVLRAVAEALRSEVPAGATLARLDGEAFALLVPELDAVAAEGLADRLRAHVGRARIRRSGEGEAERVTLSQGLAPWHAGEAAADFLARAQCALGRAKAAGRDRAVRAD